MSKSRTAYEELRRRIFQGLYRPGQKLPGEIALAEELKISRVTLRTALKQLLDEGMIESYGRSGSYVSMQCRGRRFLLVVGGGTDQLGIVAHYLASSLRYELLNAGHRLELLSAHSLAGTSPAEWNAMLRECDIAGVFLEPSYSSADVEALDLFNRTSIPIVKVLGGQNTDIYKFPVVSCDGRQCFMDGVRHLASLGHRRICTVFSDHDSRGLEIGAYKEFLRCNDLCDSDELILRTAYRDTAAAARKQLLGPRPPTAFMCFCDSRALQVYNAVRALDMKIPQQISVMGMCGYSERLFAMPRLGVVNFHYERIGAEAVKLMLRSAEWFGEGMENIQIMVPHTVEPNGSTAPPFGSPLTAGQEIAASPRIFPASMYFQGGE